VSSTDVYNFAGFCTGCGEGRGALGTRSDGGSGCAWGRDVHNRAPAFPSAAITPLCRSSCTTEVARRCELRTAEAARCRALPPCRAPHPHRTCRRPAAPASHHSVVQDLLHNGGGATGRATDVPRVVTEAPQSRRETYTSDNSVRARCRTAASCARRPGSHPVSHDSAASARDWVIRAGLCYLRGSYSRRADNKTQRGRPATASTTVMQQLLHNGRSSIRHRYAGEPAQRRSERAQRRIESMPRGCKRTLESASTPESERTPRKCEPLPESAPAPRGKRERTPRTRARAAREAASASSSSRSAARPSAR